LDGRGVITQAPSSKLPLVATTPTTITLAAKRNSITQNQKKSIAFNIKQ
jgi:hypothetical protein